LLFIDAGTTLIWLWSTDVILSGSAVRSKIIEARVEGKEAHLGAAAAVREGVAIRVPGIAPRNPGWAAAPRYAVAVGFETGITDRMVVFHLSRILPALAASHCTVQS